MIWATTPAGISSHSVSDLNDLRKPCSVRPEIPANLQALVNW